jgi:hypothetical protein
LAGGCDAPSVSFFDEPPPPAEPHEQRTPEWIGRPDNVIPATVALDAVLVRPAGRSSSAAWTT